MRSRTELKAWLRKERRRREKGGVKRGKEVGEREIVALSIVELFSSPVAISLFPQFVFNCFLAMYSTTAPDV